MHTAFPGALRVCPQQLAGRASSTNALQKGLASRARTTGKHAAAIQWSALRAQMGATKRSGSTAWQVAIGNTPLSQAPAAAAARSAAYRYWAQRDTGHAEDGEKCAGQKKMALTYICNERVQT